MNNDVGDRFDFGMDGFVAGLGYNENALESGTEVDQLMQHYMQQCLDFHHQQETRNVEAATAYAAGTSTVAPRETQFVQSVRRNEKAKVSLESAELSSQLRPPKDYYEGPLQKAPPTLRSIQQEDGSETPQGYHTTAASSRFTDEQLQAARARAHLILTRFQQQQDHFLQHPSADATTSTPTNSIYAEQRIRGFQRERERRQQALTKNFDYVAVRQRQRLDQLNEAQQLGHEYRALLEERHQQRYEQQKRAIELLRHQGGKSRVSVTNTTAMPQRPRWNREKRMGNNSAPEDLSVMTTVAVYVAGFATDGSVDSNLIQSLFSCYGRIRKIHFYRNKATGEVKGDCLVIFDVSAEEDQDAFVHTVCGQMNGAELPCGSILRVEPSRSENFTKLSAYSNASVKTATESVPAIKNAVAKPQITETEDSKTTTSTSADDQEDLDDFFSSLQN